MGRTVGELRRSMTESELTDMMRYRRKKMFPWRRIELQLAMVALVITRMHGNTETSLDDFLFDEKEPAPKLTAKQGAAIIASLSGTASKGTHVLGQGRRKKVS